MVTGGASGLGRATAEMFVQNGARAVILDLPAPKSKGPDIAAKLAGKQAPSPPTKDDQCVFLPTDVSSILSVSISLQFICYLNWLLFYWFGYFCLGDIRG